MNTRVNQWCLGCWVCIVNSSAVIDFSSLVPFFWTIYDVSHSVKRVVIGSNKG
jgi:hypothetical protein